jgi:hypothetical protein
MSDSRFACVTVQLSIIVLANGESIASMSSWWGLREGPGREEEGQGQDRERVRARVERRTLVVGSW